jgi:hypothetical protein
MRVASRESPVDLEQLRDQLIERARRCELWRPNRKLQEFLPQGTQEGASRRSRLSRDDPSLNVEAMPA